MLKHRKTLFVLLLLLAASMLACEIAIEPGGETPASPTPPLHTPTMPSWPLVLSDDFDDSESGFYVDSDETRRYFYQDGYYGIDVLQEEWFSWTWRGDIFSDFTLQVDVTPQREEGQGGVIFRMVGDQQFYLFSITPDGRYRLQKRMSEDRWETLLDWLESPHIRTGGATNRLRVVCVGSTLSLYVNDEFLDTAEDRTFTEGKIGLIAGTFEGEADALFHFDSLRVYAPGPVVQRTATPVTQATPTPVSQATATPTSTPPLTPTPTPVLATPTVPNWSLALSEDFDDPESGFYVDSDENRRLFYENGRYGIEVLREQLVPRGCAVGDFSDFVVEVDIISEGEGGQAGIAFRKGEGRRFYFFAITPEGWYKLWKWVSEEGGQWERILDWRQSPHIATGDATNRLRVVCVGSAISLYVNDQYLDSAEDATYTEGRVCMAAATFIEETHALFYFDNLRVYTP